MIGRWKMEYGSRMRPECLRERIRPSLLSRVEEWRDEGRFSGRPRDEKVKAGQRRARVLWRSGERRGPHSIVRAPGRGGQGQDVFDERRQIVVVLDMDPVRLHVELVSNGGVFGDKEDMLGQAQTALMSMLAGKPVTMTLTRPESFRLLPVPSRGPGLAGNVWPGARSSTPARRLRSSR